MLSSFTLLTGTQVGWTKQNYAGLGHRALWPHIQLSLSQRGYANYPMARGLVAEPAPAIIGVLG